jgi:hypothetical protein
VAFKFDFNNVCLNILFCAAKNLPEISRYNLEEYFFLIIFKSFSELFLRKSNATRKLYLKLPPKHMMKNFPLGF